MHRAIVCLFASLCAGVASAQEFVGLGVLAGHSSSRAVDLSTDGTTVVGDTDVQGQVSAAAWRWRMSSGLENLGIPNASARRVNGNGDVIVGYSFGTPVFYWRAGVEVTAVPANSSNLATGPGVSDDGSVVVSRDGERPATWTSAGGTVLLPFVPPGTIPDLITLTGGYSFAANLDGSVVVGSHIVRLPTDPVFATRFVPCRWTASGAEILLNNGLLLEGNAYDSSVDGNTLLVVGNNVFTGVYRWTAASGYQTVPGFTVNFTLGEPRLSGDGNTIVWYDRVWLASRGNLPITQVLTEAGADFSGWSSLRVTGVDFDASHFCGYGTNPTGQTEAWYATIPSPASAAPLIALFATLPHRRRR